jgi:hypothetical protein
MEQRHTHPEYNIPHELFADILRIVLKNKIKYQIVGMKARTNIILLRVYLVQGEKRHQEAHDNIESMLNDFQEYMDGLSDAVLYGEDID